VSIRARGASSAGTLRRSADLGRGPAARDRTTRLYGPNRSGRWSCHVAGCARARRGAQNAGHGL